MNGKSHACGLIAEEGGGADCVVDDRRRERRMEIDGDAREVD
jgi:hypothetical protein